MEKLVILDESDKELWYDLVKVHQDRYITGAYEPDEEMPLRATVQNNTSKFWDIMFKKYPYARNKRIALNLTDGYIFSWGSLSELNQYRR